MAICEVKAVVIERLEYQGDGYWLEIDYKEPSNSPKEIFPEIMIFVHIATPLNKTELEKNEAYKTGSRIQLMGIFAKRMLTV